jgi:SAM-dependent methyltransferase
MNATSKTTPATGTDEAWRQWGERDPYFGAITQAKFRRENLTPERLDEFFRSGHKHVSHVLLMCQRYIDPSFKPKRVLDFGCGVGRLLPALAAQAEQVVGLDISEAMLAEAQVNCTRLGVNNVSLLLSDNSLSAVEGDFDLVHSAIVLQHIEATRGRTLVAQLVARVRPGGIGALQLTYAKMAYAERFGAPPPLAPESVAIKPKGWRGWLSGSVISAPPAPAGVDPEMQMNVYPMNDILFILQRAGVRRFQAEYSDHGGELGLTLYFGMPAK